MSASSAVPFADLSIADQQQLMASGAANAVDLTTAYLERIERRDGPLRCVVEINPDAMSIAAALDAERTDGQVRGPLHGSAVLLKENIDTGDRMLTTAGSLALTSSLPLADSTTAERLRAAGAVVLGKTAMSEWAYFRSVDGVSGWSGRQGQVRNPYSFDRSPGGSSSGSGVAAAAGFAAATIGTETDGSIVSPATANGVVGLKPTVGLTSRHGVIPISASQDTVGPLARSVADAAAILTAIAGSDPRDPATASAKVHNYAAAVDSRGLEGAVIGCARSLGGFSRHADAAVGAAVELMGQAGARIVMIDDLVVPPELEAAEELVLLYEFADGVNAYLAHRGGSGPQSLAEVIDFNRRHADDELQHFGQELLEIAASIGPLTDDRYLDAAATARRLSRSEGLDRAFDEYGVDAIVAPTGAPAPVIDLINGDRHIGGTSTLAATAGYPLLSVPAALVAGLPVGLTFMGRAWSEHTLIRLGSAFEARRGSFPGPRFVPSL